VRGRGPSPRGRGRGRGLSKPEAPLKPELAPPKPEKSRKRKKDPVVKEHLDAADMGTGDEPISSIDVSKLTPLAKAQLRGALQVPEPPNPELAALKAGMEAMQRQLEGLSSQMKVLSTSPSLASTSTSTSESEQTKALRAENKELHKAVRDAARETAVRDALSDQDQHWQTRFADQQRMLDHWMRTAQRLMEIKPTAKKGALGEASTPDSDDPKKKKK